MLVKRRGSELSSVFLSEFTCEGVPIETVTSNAAMRHVGKDVAQKTEVGQSADRVSGTTV